MECPPRRQHVTHHTSFTQYAISQCVSQSVSQSINHSSSWKILTQFSRAHTRAFHSFSALAETEMVNCTQIGHSRELPAAAAAVDCATCHRCLQPAACCMLPAIRYSAVQTDCSAFSSSAIGKTELSSTWHNSRKSL